MQSIHIKPIGEGGETELMAFREARTNYYRKARGERIHTLCVLEEEGEADSPLIYYKIERSRRRRTAGRGENHKTHYNLIEKKRSEPWLSYVRPQKYTTIYSASAVNVLHVHIYRTTK